MCTTRRAQAAASASWVTTMTVRPTAFRSPQQVQRLAPGCLVREDEWGAVGDGAGHRDAPLFPLGKLVAQAVLPNERNANAARAAQVLSE